MTKEELKDEMKNRISLALKDPILQQGFEIICKENAELEAQIEKMKCCGNCAKNGHICVAEEMQGKLCGKNKDKWEIKND